MNRLNTRSLTAKVAALLLCTSALTVGAQTAAPAEIAATAANSAIATMNFQQLVDRVVALGYQDVREIERESDKLYEVKARNSKGQLVELTVDARSGEILREKQKSAR